MASFRFTYKTQVWNSTKFLWVIVHYFINRELESMLSREKFTPMLSPKISLLLPGSPGICHLTAYDTQLKFQETTHLTCPGWICGVLNDKNLQLKFSKQFMSFLFKNKKWMPSHFSSSHSKTPRLLHNIFVWSGILKIESYQVQIPILYEKCWECPSSYIALYQSTNGWSVWKSSNASILITSKKWIFF